MTCPASTTINTHTSKSYDNIKPFVSNASSCNYDKIGTDFPGSPYSVNANTPQTSIRVRKPEKLNVSQNKYFRYSVLEPDGHFASKERYDSNFLDMSFDYPYKIGIFPNYLYTQYPFANKSPYMDPPRDKTLLYTYSPDPEDHKERSTHTIFASRFGYDRFPGLPEYGVGEQSRGYVEPLKCHQCSNDTSPDMAPQRFYTKYHLQESPTEFRKMIGMNPKK